MHIFSLKVNKYLSELFVYLVTEYIKGRYTDFIHDFGKISKKICLIQEA